MLYDVEWNTWEQDEEELGAKLKKCEDGYYKNQRLLEALEKDMYTYKKKLVDKEEKAKDISSTVKSQRSSLEDVIRSKKELED